MLTYRVEDGRETGHGDHSVYFVECKGKLVGVAKSRDQAASFCALANLPTQNQINHIFK